MKRLVIIVLAVLLLAATLFFALWREARREQKRAQNNVETLATQAEAYRVSDSLSALSIGVLELKISELKHLRAADAQMIDRLRLRLRRVESVAKVSTLTRYEFAAEGQNSWALKDNFIDFRARKDSSHLLVELKIRDTIVQILHRVPRFKFLGIWFGTKAVRQEIVSKNPHTEIVAAEFLKIVR